MENRSDGVMERQRLLSMETKEETIEKPNRVFDLPNTPILQPPIDTQHSHPSMTTPTGHGL
jgi:hypothetical protein